MWCELARIAGNDRHYTFVLRGADGKYHRDVEIRLDSVTTIIGDVIAKPQLVPWAYKVTRDHITGLAMHAIEYELVDQFMDMLTDVDMFAEYMKENRLRPEDIRDEAAERGQAEHAFLERLATSALRDEEVAQKIAQRALADDSATGYTRAIAGWWLDSNPQVVMTEDVLYSLSGGYAGSVDLVWVDSGGYTILTDLKTGNAGRKPYSTDHIQVDGYADAYLEMYGERPDRTSVLIAREDGTFTEEYTTLPEGTFASVLQVYDNLRRG